MATPRFNLTYYKALLDKCFCRFFDEHNDLFQKQDGKYVLCQGMSQSKLENMFKKMVIEELNAFIKPFDKLNPEYFIIIGSCMPRDNMLLKFKDSYFPKKLDKLMSQTDIKYLLKEKDIDIGIEQFNYAVIKVFNQMFKKKWPLGEKYKNVMFLQHRELDCYVLFKLVKSIFGRSNCNTLFDQKQASPIVAVNELISKYIQNKMALNKSQDLKKAVDEIKRYLEEKIKECYYG